MILKPVEGYKSDYINASFVDVSFLRIVVMNIPLTIILPSTQGYLLLRQYIGTQGMYTLCVDSKYWMNEDIYWLHRSPVQDCGGLLEDGVAGESSLHCDDH